MRFDFWKLFLLFVRCYHNCVNGTCSGAPNYQCVCNLGWTGLDCGTDCGCNFHSTCQNGVGICDKCQDSTDGQFCEKCQFGYYGNPKEGKPNFAIYTQLETYCKFSDPQPQSIFLIIKCYLSFNFYKWKRNKKRITDGIHAFYEIIAILASCI